jgi:O-antigen biosynthesis protein
VTAYTVSFGQTSSGIVLHAGDTETVLSGGTASNTVVSSGGTEIISSGGRDAGARISAHGRQDVYGSASGATVSVTASQIVHSGGSASGTVVVGGTEIVSAGGTTTGTTIRRYFSSGFLSQVSINGSQIVSSGGVASGTIVDSGGEQYVYGTASGTIISNVGFELVESGGTASGTIIGSGGNQDVYGTVIGTTVSGGYQDLFSGASAISTTISAGYQYVYGTAAGTIVENGAEFVRPGGSATNIVINGGAAEVQSGGSASGITVNSGGTIIIDGGATINGLTLNSGATEAIGDSASVGGFDALAGITLAVLSGGTASGTHIESGGLEIVSAGGVDLGATVAGGGEQDVYGSASGADIHAGASQIVEPGGSALGTVVEGGGTLIVESGGTLVIYGTSAPDGTVFSAGATEAIGAGGSLSGFEVTSGLTLAVLAGGSASDITVDSGGTITIYDGAAVGGLTLQTGATEAIGDSYFYGFEVGSGWTLAVLSGAQAVYTTIDSGGQEIVSAGGLDFYAAVFGKQDVYASAIGAAVYNGGIEIVESDATTWDPVINGGTVTLEPGAIVSGSITFNGTGGQLITPYNVTNTIYGFLAGNSIDLSGGIYGTASVALLAGNVLDVTVTGINNYDLQFQLDPYYDYSSDTFQLADDGSGGMLIIEDNTPCYCRGTRILTPDGEVPVETLRIGDKVVTMSGKAQPIRWIGRRAYDGRFITGNRAVLPIRIQAGAFCPGIPSRELWVSPGHALYLAGLLIQAELLVNGMTIVQAEKVEEVEYFHIELDEHDIVYAEGALAETFTDCDNRLMFRNGAEYAALYPDDQRPAWAFCAPRLEAEDERLFPIRAALVARAEELGHRFEADPDLHLLVDGEVLRPLSEIPGVYRFEIPAGARTVWLASRNAVPAEVLLESRDIRRLGVPLERLRMFDADMLIDTGHGHAALCEGFHADEETLRRTDGLARIPDRWIGNFTGPFTLELLLSPSGLRYRVASPVPAAAVVAAAAQQKKHPAPRRKCA